MKIKKLLLLCIFAFVFLLSGCFDLGSVSTIKFVKPPQSIYYLVSSEEAMLAQQEVLEDVIVEIDGSQYTLASAIELNLVTYTGLDLISKGTKTLVVKMGEVTLTYVYKVVEALDAGLFAGGSGTVADPYQIATPEQFTNMFTRVYGVASPAKSSEETNENEAAWKTYYQACFPFYTTGVYYKLIADLDFDGEEFVPLGALGGENYVPFTGIIDGDGHTIKNVKVAPVGDASSIFAGIYGATIKNLNIDNFQCDVNSFTKYAAALSSFVFGDESFIENVHITNSQIFAQRAGGILSDGRTFIVKDCSVDENTIIAGPQYVGAVAAKSNTTRNFSYYLLTFAELDVKTVSLDGVAEDKIFIITGFTSEAKLYSSKDTNMWDGYLYADGLTFENYYIDELESKDSTDLVTNVEVVSEAPENATTVYLAVLSYSSLYTDSSNRAFVFDSTVYDAWVKGDLGVTNVKEAFDPANPPTQNDLLNDTRFDTFNAILSDGKILFDNRIFVYDADGFVNIELMTLIEASDKYRIFFKDGVVCGCN